MINFYDVAHPLFVRMDPERAHWLVIKSLKLSQEVGFFPFRSEPDDPILNCRIWDRNLQNPIGLSAGLDKNAEIIRSLFAIGFGFIEVGAITPLPQTGQTGTRLFRLAEDKALINRFGFPNHGLATISGRLKSCAKATKNDAGLVGANIGFNDNTEDALDDYIKCATGLFGLVDYITLNISCPNTPGVKDFQRQENMQKLLESVKRARSKYGTSHSPPLLIKISSDLEDVKLKEVADVAVDMGVDGIVIGNTITTRPPGLKSEYRSQTGGLSGRPLFSISTAALRKMYHHTKGEIPLIGVGGVSSGRDAYEKIRSGASLVQFYTALVYEGPGLVKRIKNELAELLRRDGYGHVHEAVGADVHLKGIQERHRATA